MGNQCRCSSIAPRLLAAPNALCDLRLKSGRTERKPVLAYLIDEAAPTFSGKPHQPIERLLLRPNADRDNHVDRQSLPDEIGREHDHVRSVRPHPIRQRAGWDQPAAYEFPARMLRTLIVDRAAIAGAERTGASRANMMLAYIDLEPAIAAGGAEAAVSRCVRRLRFVPHLALRSRSL